MTWLIIGSTAGYHWFGDQWRKPKDLDILTRKDISGLHGGECQVDAKWHELAEEVIDRSTDKVFADPRILYTLKLSHAHWDIHWDKTMFDLNKFWEWGIDPHEDLYERLVSMWNTIHKPKKVNLNQPMTTFFNDAVKRKYDHEWLHELVASPGRPMHERIRPDPLLVWCDKNLFQALTPEQQVRTVHEELLVTAIERFDLTEEASKVDRIRAVNSAYKTLCTSMTKGWFARFMIEHHVTILYKRKEQWQTLLSQTLSRLPRK